MFVLEANPVSTPLIAAARAFEARALEAFAEASSRPERKPLRVEGAQPDRPPETDPRDSNEAAAQSAEQDASTQTPRQRREALLSDPAIRVEIARLTQRDREVRAHEQAHLAVGRDLITSGPNYTYTRGPDEQRYAVAGEVGIDTSPINGDPAATAIKAGRIRDTALAPAEPSATDRQVAAIATSMEQQALAELARLLREASYSRNGSRTADAAGLLVSISV